VLQGEGLPQGRCDPFGRLLVETADDYSDAMIGFKDLNDPALFLRSAWTAALTRR
jgi:hypothetical protein